MTTRSDAPLDQRPPDERSSGSRPPGAIGHGRPRGNEAPVSEHPFIRALENPDFTVTVELRPPSMRLQSGDAVDAWIDTYHAVRRLTRANRYVFLTDNAVGADEEENLSHLEGNLTHDIDPAHVVPFLTCKHTLEYCLTYAHRAWAQGFRTLTVLGGDRSVGPPRCVPHAYMLRERMRRQVPALALGGWANPHRDAGQQAGYLAEARSTTDFFLTQIVSHHTAGRVENLLAALDRCGTDMPGVFGVFFYRSGNVRTLARLNEFFPVPAPALRGEFEGGASAEEICARSLRSLRDAGARNVYVSNLPIRGAARTLSRILAILDGL